MSCSYWVCAGIGFEQAKIVPYLSPLKIAAYMSEQGYTLPVWMNQKDAFLKRAKDAPLEVLSELEDMVDEPDGLMSLLSADSEVLESMNNHEGKNYLLFPPRFPWQYVRLCQSEKEVCEHLCQSVLRFCRDDVRKETLYGLIDSEIYDIACG